MKQKVDWTLDGIDPNAREAARAAAEKAGMDVGTWLAQVIDEKAAPRETAYDAPPRGTPVGDAIDAIAARLESLAMARRATPPEIDALAAATAASERRLRETSAKTAAALDSVARWMEDADSRTSLLVGRVVREVEERQDDTTAMVGEAFSSVTGKLQTLESRIAETAPALAPLKETLGRVEARLAETVSGRADVGRLEKTLSGFEERLGSIAERLAASRRPMRREGLGGALADIRARQSELDPRHAGGASTRRSAVEEDILHGLRTDMAKLAGQLDTLQDNVTNGPMWLAGEIGQLHDAIQALAPRTTLSALDAAVSDLGRKLEGTSADLAPVRQLHGEIASLNKLLAGSQTDLVADLKAIAGRLGTRDGKDSAALAGQIAELRDFIEMSRGDARLPTLIDAVSDLSARLGTMQDRQVDALEFATLKSTVEDIRDVLSGTSGQAPGKAPRRAAGTPDFAGEFRSHLEGLAARIDRLSERLETPQAVVDPQLSGRIDGLSGKIDTLSERLARPATESGKLSALMEDLVRRLDTAHADRGGDGSPALDAIARQISRIAEKLDAPEAAAITAVERAFGDLSRQIETLRDGKITSEPAEDARIERMLGAIGGTLESVVTRIQDLEKEATERPAPRPPTAAADASDTILPPAASSAPQSAPAGPENDLPLEPGSGRPMRRATDRPAAATAAPAMPAPALPPLTARREDGADVKANFIAAARRAAQAAAAETAGRARPTLSERLRLGAATAPEAAKEVAKAAKASARSSVEAPVTSTAPLADKTSAPPSAAPDAARATAMTRLRAALAKRRTLILALAAVVLALGAAKVTFDTTAPGPSQTVQEAPKPTPPKDVDVTNALPSGASSPREPMLLQAPLAPVPPQTALASPPALAPAPEAPAPAVQPAPPMAVPALPAAPAVRVAGIRPADLPNGLPEGLRKAAVAGDPVAAYDAASRLADGRDVTRDINQSLKLFEKAASDGYAPAQFRLGSTYEKGIGVPRDIAIAKSWYRRAADRGHARAMHNLAVTFAEGGDGAPDYAKAVEWFTQAANYGVRDSQYNLAILCARGLGTPRDLKVSYMWFAAAAAEGDADAGRKRDEVASRLSPAELSAAKDMAAGFKAKPLDPSVNEVTVPAGGYADTASAAPAPAKARVKQRLTSAQTPRI